MAWPEISVNRPGFPGGLILPRNEVSGKAGATQFLAYTGPGFHSDDRVGRAEVFAQLGRCGREHFYDLHSRERF